MLSSDLYIKNDVKEDLYVKFFCSDDSYMRYSVLKLGDTLKVSGHTRSLKLQFIGVNTGITVTERVYLSTTKIYVKEGSSGRYFVL